METSCFFRLQNRQSDSSSHFKLEAEWKLGLSSLDSRVFPLHYFLRLFIRRQSRKHAFIHITNPYRVPRTVLECALRAGVQPTDSTTFQGTIPPVFLKEEAECGREELEQSSCGYPAADSTASLVSS